MRTLTLLTFVLVCVILVSNFYILKTHTSLLKYIEVDMQDTRQIFIRLNNLEIK